MAGEAAIVGPTSVANNGFLDLQPGSGTEWIIHNYSYAGAMELYFYDGTNSVKADEDTTAGSRRGEQLHVTNTKYYRIKNISGASALICADGVVSKP